MSGEKNSYCALLKDAGISGKTLDAIESVDRKIFFDPMFSDALNSMEPIPIGAGQKSDNLLTLAKIIDLLELQEKWRVLEVGTGSGYSTAVLSKLVAEVITVEYHEDLAVKAKERMTRAGYVSLRFLSGDATDGAQGLGEFDAAVIFTACVRTPYSIINMLKSNGVAVFPMGPAHEQQIVRFINKIDAPDFSRNFKFYDPCYYDSIRGKYGWIDRPEMPLALESDEKQEGGR